MTAASIAFSALPVTRDEARKLNAKHYFTREPCANGHVDRRLTSDGRCQTCNRERAAKRYRDDPAAGAKRAAEWRAANIERSRENDARHRAKPESKIKQAAKMRRWRDANATHVRSYAKTYRELNKERIRVNFAYYRRVSGKGREYAQRYKARKLRATPPWADYWSIQIIYEACPAGYQVDHIVPLKSPIVCGLHTVANLQYLSASENARKNNRTWPDMP